MPAAAVGIVDGAGRLTFCNAAWHALAGRTGPYGELGSLVAPEDTKGALHVRRLAELKGPLALPAHELARAIQDTLADGEGEGGCRIAYRRPRPDGDEPYEAFVARLPADVPLVAVLHVDTTDRERAAAAVAEAVRLGLDAEELRSQQRILRRRLEDIGRSLHNPITPVRLEMHLLQSGALGPLTEAQQRALAIVSRNVQRWTEGAEDFLHVPAEERSTTEPLDLAALALDVASRSRTQALKQGIRLVNVPHADPLPIQSSAELLGDILIRVVARALRVTPAGGSVAIEARLQGGEALVEVRDSGPGVSARELRTLFEPWASGRPPRDAALAFELAHARVSLQSSGGRVWAESEGVGQGLLIGLALPISRP